MDCSKYITDYLNHNRIYMDKNENTVNLDNVKTDESDSPLRQQSSRVFCCGEPPRVATKLLLGRSGPGQAVQVLTVTDRNSDSLEQTQAKKQKIAQVQQI